MIPENLKERAESLCRKGTIFETPLENIVLTKEFKNGKQLFILKKDGGSPDMCGIESREAHLFVGELHFKSKTFTLRRKDLPEDIENCRKVSGKKCMMTFKKKSEWPEKVALRLMEE